MPFLIAFSFASFIASGITSIPNTSPQCCNNERYYLRYAIRWNFVIIKIDCLSWFTFEKQRPMVPVPQHTSSNAVSIVGAARSIAALYRTSAPNVLTWKNAWGETRNFMPTNVSSMYSVPLTWYNVSLLSPPMPLQIHIIKYTTIFVYARYTHFLSIVWKYNEVTPASTPFPVSKNTRSCVLNCSNSLLLRSWGCIATINIKWLARVVRAVTCLQYPLWSTGLKGSKLDSCMNVSSI